MQWNAVMFTCIIGQFEIKAIVLIEINLIQWGFAVFHLLKDFQLSDGFHL